MYVLTCPSIPGVVSLIEGQVSHICLANKVFCFDDGHLEVIMHTCKQISASEV